MGETAIGWTGRTWNPVTGCDRISAGCDHCYALTLAARLQRMGNLRYVNDGDPRTSGPGFAVTMHPDKLDEPLHWRKPSRVFVNSMSDLFHKDVPWHFIASVFDTMRRCPHLTFQVLTKRSQRLLGEYKWEVERAQMYGNTNSCTVMLDANTDAERIVPIPNVHIGVTVESDAYKFRIRHLLETPAAVRFVSFEPLLEPIRNLDLTGIDWVIIGCESGHGARPFDTLWADEIMVAADHAGAKVFVKQVPDPARKGGTITDPALFPFAWLRRQEFPC